ncbi:MAG: DUF4190 domain-containing protein [Candidatus Omnitrophica bacterium]|nr:DUF4190 domain-containing protein [Candidatus Omnitrophota bacterium]
MTEVAVKKTVGLAVASLVMGCLVLIPILGLLFSLLAIIFGAVALAKISNNKDKLKGDGLAISGIILGAFGIIVVPIIFMLLAIAVPAFMRAKAVAEMHQQGAPISENR